MIRTKWADTNSAADTVRLMLAWADRYRQDMQPFAGCSPSDLYAQLKALPYIPDPKEHESIARPRITMDPTSFAPRDCDDKSTAWAAWAILCRVPSVLRVVRADGAASFHHVYPALIVRGSVVPMDPTFPDRGEPGRTLYREADALTFAIP